MSSFRFSPPPRNTLMSTFLLSYFLHFSSRLKLSISCENNCQFTCVIRDFFSYLCSGLRNPLRACLRSEKFKSGLTFLSLKRSLVT